MARFSRCGAPVESVAAGAGAGRCSGLPPVGCPPCAEGAKAEWPYQAVASRGRRARQVPRKSLRSQVGCALRWRGRAIGARRAPRAFKDVKKVLTDEMATSGD
jgi:hypothetical protein